jgi:hypothetical protein
MVDPKGRQSPPCIPAPGPALWSHPCVAISSVQAPIPYHKTASPNRNNSHHRYCLYYGPELTSRHFLAWCIERRIDLRHIQPGRPMQNGHVESFHGKLRDECLNTSWFRNLFDARKQIAAWKRDYNEHRPHSSLQYQTPAEFAKSVSSPSTLLHHRSGQATSMQPCGLAPLGIDVASHSAVRSCS